MVLIFTILKLCYRYFIDLNEKIALEVCFSRATSLISSLLRLISFR